MRQGTRTVAAGLTAAAVLAAASGCSVGDDDSTDGGGTGAPTAEEASEVATDFLDAWADDDTTGAGELSDDPKTASAALVGFAEDTGLTDLEIAPGEAQSGSDGEGGTTVPFTVRATLEYGEEETDWEYDSELTVVRVGGDGASGDSAGDTADGESGEEDTEGGEAVVAWQSRVLHPQLPDGGALEVGGVRDAPPVQTLDRHGEQLDLEAYPSLEPLMAEVREAQAEAAGASTGAELRITGDDAPEDPLVELAPARGGEIPTTIDPEVQQAAEEALADAGEASLVAVEPSTGAIRAVANKPPSGGDPDEPANPALRGVHAPGSTWKIVTSGLLVEEELAEPGEEHPCPQFYDHGGWEFHNLDEFEIEDGTFTDSFTASCNTAFISAAPELGDDQLGDYAASAFGIGLEWRTGISVVESGAVPEESDAQMAAQLIGQAGVRANPLVLASLSATVQDGEFRQPFLVPPDFDDRELAEASGPSEETAAQLRGLMAATASHGTAAEAMAGLSGDIGAKTGSAEVPDQDDPNAWFTAYRGDLAVAAMVPDVGHGGTYAGPPVADVLAVIDDV